MSTDHQLHVNRKLWDEWAVIHERSDFYDVQTFKEGRNTLAPHEAGEVGGVNGKSLLHLMCHIGLDTMSWSRVGAKAVGIDFSPRSIELARDIAKEVELPTVFVESDVYDVNSELDGEKFDVVYTSHGVLPWLPDIDAWARVITAALKPGGTFYISELHPFSRVLAAGSLHPEVRRSYFESGASEWETQGTYADPSVSVETSTHFRWRQTLGDVVSALIDAGLVIEFLHEWNYATFQQLDGMERNDAGMWTLPGSDLPFLFSLRAHLPVV